MLEYLELIIVMTAVGVPFYLYISITHYFHAKTEKSARATAIRMQDQGDTITALEGEVKALHGRIHALENDLDEASAENFDMTSVNRTKVA